MVRWMQDADRDAVVALMNATVPKPARFTYADMDGECLVDEVDGQIRGMALISVARPYTVIREMCIAPEHRRGLVLANLSTAILAVAKVYGAQGVQGFKL